MSTLRNLRAGLGISLAAALAFVGGSASADDAVDQTQGEAVGEEALALAAGILCTVSSGISPTGREWAKLTIIKITSQGEVICSRVRTGGVAPQDFPSCYQRRSELGCHVIVD